MKAEKRREKMLRLIRNNPSISPAGLAEELAVALETTRGDLIALEKEGIVTRRHGKVELRRNPTAYEKLLRHGVLSKQERRREVLRIIEENREVRISDIARAFNVSGATVRNDLIALEEKGSVKRTHGGAVPVGPPGQSLDISCLVSEISSLPVRYICRRALGLVEQGDQIFLDDSVFGACMALGISQESEVTIVTNSLKVALILARRSYACDVFMLPGLLQTDELAVDIKLHAAIRERLFISKAFIGLPAYAPGRGFFVDSHRRLDTLALIAEIADAYFLMIESTGVGQNGRYGLPLTGETAGLREILVDDGLEVERAAECFPDNYPVTLCGENYALKSPFNKQYTIGFAFLHGDYEFSQTVRRSIETAARQYSNLELILADNRMDSETALKNIETFIRSKVDLVIEYQENYELGPLIAEKLSHAGIPILAVDIPVPGAVYFGANNYQAGLMAGEAAANEVQRRWDGHLDNLIVVTEAAAGPIPGNRITGMLEAFLARVPFDREHIVEVDTVNDPAASESKSIAVLRTIADDKRVLILSFNVIATFGVLKALRKLGMQGRAVVAGHNYIRGVARELEREGSPLLGSVAFYPEDYGPRIMELALRILRKEPVQPNNYTEHRWIGKHGR